MNKNWPINEIQDAWELATKMHNNQKYGGAKQDEQIEYLNHIGSVVFEVMNAAALSPEMNADLAIKCAILHDTLEDTTLTYEEVRNQFGSAVADGVLALTKSETIEGRKEKMLDSLRRIQEQPQEIWAVKMADRICNLFTPPFYWKDDKKLYYLEEASLIYEALKDANAYLAKRLYEKMERYKGFIG